MGASRDRAHPLGFVYQAVDHLLSVVVSFGRILPPGACPITFFLFLGFYRLHFGWLVRFVLRTQTVYRVFTGAL